MNFSISAVIPVYNGERFLKDALDSVTSQTHKVDEIVIIDDGSSDNSFLIATEYQQTSPIPINVFQQSNSGVSAARNLGILKSSSTLIAFLDVDDLWLPTKIEEQMKDFVETLDDTLFSFTDYYSDKQTNESRKFFHTPGAEICSEPDYSKEKFQIAFVQANFIGTASTVIFNRELALKINGFNVRMNHSEDFDFILRYSRHANMKCVNKPLVLKRHHGDNLTGNMQLHYWSHCLALSINIDANSNFSRFNYDSEVVREMKFSYDEYLIRLCNEIFEENAVKGLGMYLSSILKTKSNRGRKHFILAFLRKLIRVMSFNIIKR